MKYYQLLSEIPTIVVDRCPICGARERKFLFAGYDHLHDLPGSFPVVRCVACEAIYMLRRPVDLASYYPAKSYAGYAGLARTGPGVYRLWRHYSLNKWRRLIERLKPSGGQLLDVGCGTGDFLALMATVPCWQVMGIEPNAEAVRYASNMCGLKVLQGELPMPELPTAEYDVITMWHVLEHISNPVAVLGEVHRLLKADGILVLSLPMADSLEAQWFGANWAGYDVPRHLVTFSRVSFVRFMERMGFQVEEQLGLVWGFVSLWQSLYFVLVDKFALTGNVFRFLSMLILAPILPCIRFLIGRHLGVAVFVARRTVRHA